MFCRVFMVWNYGLNNNNGEHRFIKISLKSMDQTNINVYNIDVMFKSNIFLLLENNHGILFYFICIIWRNIWTSNYEATNSLRCNSILFIYELPVPSNGIVRLRNEYFWHDIWFGSASFICNWTGCGYREFDLRYVYIVYEYSSTCL